MNSRTMDEYFVPTRSSKALGTPAHDVVVHSDKAGDSKAAKQKKTERDNTFDELDMKNARFEIYKFAQTGLKNIDKQKNQKELAVKLGAVPPKRTNVNYKKFKDELKKQKEKEKEAAELSKLGYIHRPVRNYKQSGRNPKAKLHKKMQLGTGILKKYGTVSWALNYLLDTSSHR